MGQDFYYDNRNVKTALLWNTFGGDIEWFKVSARSYKKFARGGWHWAKCIVPNPDIRPFREPCEDAGILLVGYDEWPGKGFNHHQMLQCYGDKHFPEADAIFHIDSDSIFSNYCTSDNWVQDGKILLPFTDFKHFLKTPIRPDEEKHFMGCTGRVMDFNRGQYFWKWAAECALGFEVPRETMAWMPITHYREVYSKTRQVIEERFKIPFEEYVKSCRNEWPQSFAEFNTLGGVAYKFFKERYSWRNIHEHGYPFAGLVTQCWSHGGFDRPHTFAGEVGGHQTPRQLFERLGLL